MISIKKADKIIQTPIKNIKSAMPENIAENDILEISKKAGDCISNIQQGLIKAQKTFPKLNKNSDPSIYFGVDSAANIQKQINNQMALSWIKMREQGLVSFPPAVLSGDPDTKSIGKALNKLTERGFGRLTVTDKLFGNGIEDGTHTVGMVYNKGKYYILDSIPESYPKIKDFHKRLVKFLGLNEKDVVFPNKPQQSIYEYTCNNWTHANLDAVISYLKNSPEEELTAKVFDKILPEDINIVLSKQYRRTCTELRGRDLSELVAQLYKDKTELLDI